MFLVVLSRSGPEWDASLPMVGQQQWSEHAAFMDDLVERGFLILGGPLWDETRVVYAVEAESEHAVRSRLANDPWNETTLVIESIDAWTIRLDGR
jgi:uncharacterized protein YciI